VLGAAIPRRVLCTALCKCLRGRPLPSPSHPPRPPNTHCTPRQAVGTLRPEAASALGLPVGVVVAPGSGDNAMAALGSGAVSDGQLVVSLGTSGTLFGACARPIVDPSGVVAPFCDAAGAWLPLVCTLNCTKVPEEVREAFGLSQDDATELAAKEEPGSGGVNFLPYLVGARTPNWPHSSGAILGLRPGARGRGPEGRGAARASLLCACVTAPPTSLPPPTAPLAPLPPSCLPLGMLRPGLLYRAALEGATFSLVAGLERMQVGTGAPGPRGVQPARLAHRREPDGGRN
jgi:sugar (pentulose or hexulose) kinase